MQLLIVNGSLRGAAGNTAAYLRAAIKRLPPGVECHTVHLADDPVTPGQMERWIGEADGIVLGTGCYWDTWGSPLQRWIEEMTALEASSAFVGKPVGVLVTMDSVGGESLAWRLLGVMNLLGCLIPPMAAVVLSRVGVAVKQVDAPEGFDAFDDVWEEGDLDILFRNILRAQLRVDWETWPVGREITPAWPKD